MDTARPRVRRTAETFGGPLKCPKCPDKHYYGWLWLPNLKSRPCPNCGTRLVSVRRKRTKGAGE